MNYVLALWSVLLPLVMLVVPGLGLIRPAGALSTLLRVVLASISTTILATVAGAIVGLPVEALWIGLVILTIWGVWVHRAGWRVRGRKMQLAAMIVVGGLGVFTIPYLWYQDGLPTGDIQKAIVWGQMMLDTNHLPDYSQAVPLLNRDPVDFYTPGLHAFTALALALSPVPLLSAGLLALTVALVIPLLAAGLAAQVGSTGRWWPYLAAWFVVGNIRWLRYVREPGYHWQNAVGEVLLLGVLYLGLTWLRGRQWRDVVLALMVAGALVLSHQFSAFLAPFMLLPVVAAVMYTIFRDSKWLTHSWQWILAAVGGVVALGWLGWRLDLQQKLPALFTSRPHLLPFVPSLLDYPVLLGTWWVVVGLAGLMWLVGSRRQQSRLPRWVLVASSLVLLALSAGPRFGLDIPPVRALFYMVVPMSVGAAVLVRALWQDAPGRLQGLAQAAAVIFAAVTLPAVASLYRQPHPVRTNSTLSAEYETLVGYVRYGEAPGNVLVDDYNRRSTTWMTLAQRPVFVRSAGDVPQQQGEVTQSKLRAQLYQRQLDFEKIFALGSTSTVAELLQKYDITYVTGIAGSSESVFTHNPLLREVRRANDTVLYERRREPAVASEAPTALSPEVIMWLLRPSTLANDIGDSEDVFLHLPASVGAVRLSEPRLVGGGTARVTSALSIPLQFNVGDYVLPYWDKDGSGTVAAAAQLLVQFSSIPRDVRLLTASGRVVPLTARLNWVRLAPEDVVLDDEGFVTIELLNPTAEPVALDMIALGQARVP